jgi:hypothetical protein
MDRVTEGAAREDAVRDAYIMTRTYDAVPTDETGRRCARCQFPIRKGFDAVGDFCSNLCAGGGTYNG